MGVRLFLRDLPLVDEALNVGVVGGAKHHVCPTEVVDAAVADVGNASGTIWADDESRQGAVRLFLGGDRRELDHQVGLFGQLLEELLGQIVSGRVTLEQLLGGQDHLIGRFASTAFAAHAIGHNGEQAALGSGVGQDGDLVLLIGPVSAMGACGGDEAETGGSGRHGENYNA